MLCELLVAGCCVERFDGVEEKIAISGLVENR